MKKHVILAAALVAVTAPADSWSAAWTLGSNVRVVQKGGSGTNVYASIGAALQNISSSNATPILVKVMPGTYTETVTMKPFVDIEGSGQGNTIIISSVANNHYLHDVNTEPTKATVTMAANTRLSNLKVVNTSATGGGTAILTKAKATRIENVTAEASTTDPGAIYDYGAIVANGINQPVVPEPSVTVVLTHVTAKASTPFKDDCPSRAIVVSNGAVAEILDSHVEASGGTWARGVYLTGGEGAVPKITVRNSTFEAWGAFSEAAGIYGDGAMKIVDSDAYAHDTPTCHAISLNSGGEVIGSELRVSTCPNEMAGIRGAAQWFSSTVATSLIESGYIDMTWVRGCWAPDGSQISFP